MRARRLHDWASPGCGPARSDLNWRVTPEEEMAGEHLSLLWQQYSRTLVLRAPRPVKGQGSPRGWGSSNTGEWCLLEVYRGAIAHLGSRECSQCWSGLIWSDPSGVTAAADAICPRSLWNCFRGTTFLPLKQLRQFSPAWACSSVRHAVIFTESNSTPRKEILCTGESLLLFQLTRSPNWLRCHSTKSLSLAHCRPMDMRTRRKRKLLKEQKAEQKQKET